MRWGWGFWVPRSPEESGRSLRPWGAGTGRQGVSGCHPQAEDESHSFTLTSETNTATVTQLSPGHIYGFQVRARTAAGHGPFGGKVYFQTLPQGERKPGWKAPGVVSEEQPGPCRPKAVRGVTG